MALPQSEVRVSRAPCPPTTSARVAPSLVGKAHAKSCVFGKSCQRLAHPTESEGSLMNIELRQPDVSQKTRLKVIDVDIHPKSGMEDLRPYLAQRWWDHYKTYGARTRQGFLKGFPYPKSQPIASRRDSWPPGGGLPGSDLNFMKQQYLDLYPIEYAIMNPL